MGITQTEPVNVFLNEDILDTCSLSPVFAGSPLLKIEALFSDSTIVLYFHALPNSEAVTQPNDAASELHHYITTVRKGEAMK